MKNPAKESDLVHSYWNKERLWSDCCQPQKHLTALEFRCPSPMEQQLGTWGGLTRIHSCSFLAMLLGSGKVRGFSWELYYENNHHHHKIPYDPKTFSITITCDLRSEHMDCGGTDTHCYRNFQYGLDLVSLLCPLLPAGKDTALVLYSFGLSHFAILPSHVHIWIHELF